MFYDNLEAWKEIRMRYVKLALLLTLTLVLVGCGGEFFDDGDGTNDGGADTGGDYDAYWDTIETFSAEGYIPEMTQNHQRPSWISPTLMVLLWGWAKTSLTRMRICHVRVNGDWGNL